MKTIQVMMFVVFLMAMGCKSNEKAVLTAQEWQLKEMISNGTASGLPQNLPEILFTDSTAVYGSAGCNRFFGTYTIDDKGGMKIQPGGSTMMFCPDMEFEDQYLKTLGAVATYTVKPDELKITTADHAVTLIYIPKDTTKLIGVAKDGHGCNAAAGYTWSEVQQDCIRLFETGIRMKSVTDPSATCSAFLVFAADSAQAEVFLPEGKAHHVLDRRELPDGGFVWNVEDDDTLNVRESDGNWIIEQRRNVIYSQDKE